MDHPLLDSLVKKNLPKSRGMMVYGKPIEDCSRDDLIAVIVEMAKLFKYETELGGK